MSGDRLDSHRLTSVRRPTAALLGCLVALSAVDGSQGALAAAWVGVAALGPESAATPTTPQAALEAIATRYRAEPFAERVTITAEPSAPGAPAKRATLLIAGDVSAGRPELSVLHVDLGPIRLWLTPTRTLFLPGLPPASTTATLAGAAPPPEVPARAVMLLRQGPAQPLMARLDDLVREQRIGPVPAPHLAFFLPAPADGSAGVNLGGSIGLCRFDALLPAPPASATLTLSGRCDAGPVKVSVDRQTLRLKTIEATLTDGKLTMEFRAVGTGEAVRIPQPPDLTPLRRVETLSELGRALAKPPADRRLPESVLALAERGPDARPSAGSIDSPAVNGKLRVIWMQRAGLAGGEKASLTQLRAQLLEQIGRQGQAEQRGRLGGDPDLPLIELTADGRISQEAIDWLLGDADASVVCVDSTGVAALVRLIPRSVGEVRAETLAKELLASVGP